MSFIVHRFRVTTGIYFVAAGLAVALALSPGRARSETPTPPPVTNEIRFSMTVGSAKGQVICAIFRKDGWLKAPIQSRKSGILGSEAECVFTGVSPDVYAISAFHDENDNGKLDTGLFGIPTENWCASRDAKGTFGPPSFDDAKFRYAGGVLLQRASLK
jgi:uncharacterized protein (DUF2141 family)